MPPARPLGWLNRPECVSAHHAVFANAQPASRPSLSPHAPQVSHREYNSLSINSVHDMKGQQKQCLKYFNHFMEAEG